MHDYKSPYANIAEVDRHAQICKSLKLEEDWIPDTEVQAAIDEYNRSQQTASVISLKDTRETLLNASKIVKILNQTINDSIGGDNKDMATALDTLETLLTISDKLPKTISSIVALEEKVQKEQHENSKVRGGGKAGSYEN